MSEIANESQPIFSTLGGDPDLGPLVEMFVDEMPDRIQTLLDHADHEDWQQLTWSAHQFKGSAGSYGFDQFTSCLATLEQAAARGGSREDIREMLDEIASLAARVRSGAAK